MTTPERCGWVTADPLYIAYHDTEWGRPIREDRLLFEFLMLEGMQAGLSWLTILKKRPRYREVFAGFDPAKIALFDEAQIETLLKDPGIIRNRLKVNAIVKNARAYLAMQKEGIVFHEFLWQFVGGNPRVNHWQALAQIPTKTPEAELMSKALKARGFTFVGPTICYAFMQAVGMVNDHTLNCCYRINASL